MKITPFLAALCVLPLVGCVTAQWTEVARNRADNTNPKLTFVVYYERASLLNGPSIEVPSPGGHHQAHTCVYVNNPFYANAYAYDDGGIIQVSMAPGLGSGDKIKVREDGIRAYTTPNIWMIDDFENPGVRDGVMYVNFVDGPIYDRGSLFGFFELLSSTAAAEIRARVSNSSANPGYLLIKCGHTPRANCKSRFWSRVLTRV